MQKLKRIIAAVTAATLIFGGHITQAASAHAAPTGIAHLSNKLTAPATLVAGSASWNFVNSFRTYVGQENETLTGGASLLTKSGDMHWQAAPNQNFDPANPGQLRFSGNANWNKYGGFLNVDIGNLVLDFNTKQLLVDAKTNGTLSGKPAQTYTQQPLLELADLDYEVRENTLIVFSHEPVVTSLSDNLVGFYKGIKGAPFVATFDLQNSDLNYTRPEPVLWEIFPTKYQDPRQTPPLTDPNEATFEVHVPDATLRNCIFEELEIPNTTAIVNKVLQQLQSFDCVGARLAPEQKVKDLTGLEHARNLNTLKIQYNQVSDLSPLQNLKKLHTLYAAHNKISDISVLANFEKLATLSLDNNRIVSLDPLQNLAELSVIKVNNNRVASANGLPYRVTNFEAENNKIADVTGISLQTTPYLRRLNMRHNRIVDVSPMRKLRVLERVDLRNNFITDPCPLAEWENHNNLSSFRIDYNKFTDWNCIADVPRVDKPRPGETGSLNPKTQVDLDAQDAQDAKNDAAEASAAAEAANPVVATPANTSGYPGDTQRSDSKTAGNQGLTPAEMFVNTPAGATYSLENAGGADSIKLVDKGEFTIAATGEVTFEPLADFTDGTATVTIVLTTLAGNTYKADYTVTVKPLPEPQVLSALANITAADTVTLSAGPFVPGEAVTIEVHSTPILVGAFNADAQGIVTTTWQVPASLADGKTHTVYFKGVRGKTASAKFTVQAQPVKVNPAPAAPAAPAKSTVSSGQQAGAKTLAKTGLAAETYQLLLAAILVAAGIVLVTVRRDTSKR